MKESREYFLVLRYEAGRPLGPLDGVPLAMKDELDMKGFVTKLGSTYNTHPKEPATRDDIMVSRMRETGTNLLPWLDYYCMLLILFL